jgi:hypothetical protein
VVRADPQPLVEVEPVGVGAVRPRTRVQVQLGAARPARLGLEPAHERRAVPAAAAVGAGDEVVDVEVPPPREVLADPEAGGGRGLRLAVLEGGHDAVAARALGVGARRQRAGVTVVRAQLEQGGGRQRRLALRQLADLAHLSSARSCAGA